MSFSMDKSLRVTFRSLFVLVDVVQPEDGTVICFFQIVAI